jgi:hypothetical protein
MILYSGKLGKKESLPVRIGFFGRNLFRNVQESSAFLEMLFGPVFNELKQAIRWKVENLFNLNVSSFHNSFQVTEKSYIKPLVCVFTNQQVTNVVINNYYTLVGTPEAACLLISFHYLSCNFFVCSL